MDNDSIVLVFARQSNEE